MRKDKIKMERVYKIVLKALSPIAVTKRQYNILFLTEYFIPGWTVWGALVKLYAIGVKNGDYRKAQKDWQNVRLTNFYVMDEDGKIYLPKKEGNKIKWSDLSANEFAQKFVASEIKVSIDPLTNTSAEGMLYEREFIGPLEFIGGMKIKDDGIERFLKEIKGKNFFIGADKNTGFGRIRMEKVEKLEDNKDWIFQTLKTVQMDKYLIPAEMEVKKVCLIFPLVLRLWDEGKGSGIKIEYKEFVQFPDFSQTHCSD